MRLLVLTCLSLASLAAARASVVVSFQPYYTVTRNIAGTQADVLRLVPIGANPHQFEPRPSDLRAVSGASLIVLNGLGLDAWIAGLVRNSGTKARLLTLGDQLKFEPLSPMPHLLEEASSDPDEHGSVDPHLWLDARNMAGAALLIGAELARVDPTHAAQYQQRARAERDRLIALDAELRRTLAPVKQLSVVTFHGAWGYWSRAYGPKIAAVVEPFPGKEPSAKYVTTVVGLLRQHRARAVFAEPQLPLGPAQVIAESAGTKAYVVAPEGDAGHPDYYEMMRANAQTFLKALK